MSPARIVIWPISISARVYRSRPFSVAACGVGRRGQGRQFERHLGGHSLDGGHHAL
jgi:hypothetical protein